VKFELTDQTRQAVDDYLKAANKKSGEYLFTGRRGQSRAMSTRQYARLPADWVASIGLDPKVFGTHWRGDSETACRRFDHCTSRAANAWA
jgi:hypothetical protein